MSHDARLADLVILNGAVVSNSVENPVGIQNIVEMLIYAPAAIDGVVTVQVSPVQSPAAGDWCAFQFVPGTDVTIAAAKAVRVAARCIKAIRLSSTVAATADRTFRLVVQQDT